MAKERFTYKATLQLSLKFTVQMWKERSVLLCFFFLNLLITFCDCQKAEGDQCLTRTLQQGVCIIVSKCPAIKNDIFHGKFDHERCGFLGDEEVVCCPSEPDESILSSRQFTPTARVSARKCSEYKEYAYEKYYVMNTPDTPQVEIIDDTCAFTAVPLIVGGTEAKKNAYPHMALIGYRVINETKFYCGGTLISEQFVLTAAHCINTRYGLAALVRLGEHDKNRIDETSHIDYNVIERIVHPEYMRLSMSNDIALLQLERPVMFNSLIRPACLPEKSNVPTKTAIASGWGRIGPRERLSNVLLEVTVDIFSHNNCSNELGRISLRVGIDEGRQLCAGSYTESKDTCKGDSGGPLQIYHETHSCCYTVVGITSFGKSVCGTIGVYTRVFAYLSWIEDIVWPNQ